MSRARSTRRGARQGDDADELAGIDESLLDLVDHVLTKGVVLTGDLVLGVADIDLIYLRLSAVLCAADRVLGPSREPPREALALRETPTHARRRPLIAKRFGAPKLRAKRA